MHHMHYTDALFTIIIYVNYSNSMSISIEMCSRNQNYIIIHRLANNIDCIIIYYV